MARRKLGVRDRPARRRKLTQEEEDEFARAICEGLDRLAEMGGIENCFDEHIDWDALEAAKMKALPASESDVRIDQRDSAH
jgi:hypothetical protein